MIYIPLLSINRRSVLELYTASIRELDFDGEPVFDEHGRLPVTNARKRADQTDLLPEPGWRPS